MNEKCEKDLVAFCMLINSFLESTGNRQSTINDEDRREIERDFNIKLILPVEEPKWILKDLQPPPPSRPYNGTFSFLL